MSKEQRSDADRDRRDPVTDARLGLRDETVHDFDAPGGFGDLRHSLTTHWKVQQR